MRYEAIVIGVSSGGLKALKIIFSALPSNFAVPVIVVQHIGPRSENSWIKLLNDSCIIPIKEADEKEKVGTRSIYVAPSNYHLMIEKDKTFSLTIDERVNFARPSIDVLFESAAEAYKEKLIGIILTGANNDGTKGVKRIKECGGIVIIQDPETAESSYMPASAIAAVQPDYIQALDQIGDLIIKITQNNNI
jgi:two-component system chemotaxis response regulator CheB